MTIADCISTLVQCMKGKCPRAYHATCALQDDSGALVTFEQPQDEPVNVSKDPETSTEGEATKTLMLCKQHNPVSRYKVLKQGFVQSDIHIYHFLGSSTT